MPTETFESLVTRLGLRYCEGLQAISRKEKALITAEDTRKILGSANLDEDLRERLPNASRWDYVVAYSAATKTLYFIEIHPAGSDSKAKEILAKKAWLDDYLATEGQALKAFAKKRLFYWVVPSREGKRGHVPPKDSRIYKILASKARNIRGPMAELKLT